jgi:peptidoglycan-associated lipoprotein
MGQVSATFSRINLMNAKRRHLALLAAFCTALVLTGCGSTVKLDEVPVSDAKGTQVSSTQTTSPSSVQSSQAAVSERSVQAVNVAPIAGDASGPLGVARVILFDYDSYDIKPEYQAAVDSHARFLTANRARKLAIEGHTDERGGREYNLALGQKRAEAVRRALALLGVSDAQMEAVSFGKEKPVDSASSEAAYAKNRRAELSYR